MLEHLNYNCVGRYLQDMEPNVFQLSKCYLVRCAFSHSNLKANFNTSMCCEKNVNSFDFIHILHLQQSKYRNLYTRMGVAAFKLVTWGRWTTFSP